MSESVSNGIAVETMAVVEQSLSPDNRNSQLHTRNSSKTLKCPKCNWHYKYQETLEIHMKEKHQSIDGPLSCNGEGEGTCSYCLSNTVHPRLARGEQYACGFKPYRCELCLYSTTTKGNLAIHMQSDKHMNNCRDLSIPTNNSTSSPSPSTLDLTPSPQEMKVTPESTSSISSPDIFSCPLCSQSNLNTLDSLKEHLCSIHHCTKEALARCLSLIDSSVSSSSVNVADGHDRNGINDEFRCHSCSNKTFRDLEHLIVHLQEHNIDEQTNVKSAGLLCWKKGCNQYFSSLNILEKHFREIHCSSLVLDSISKSRCTDNQEEKQTKIEKSTCQDETSALNGRNNTSNEIKMPSQLNRWKESLISIGNDIVCHYLENNDDDQQQQMERSLLSTFDLTCDLCYKSFSSLTTLKVHYEQSHSILLSSKAIEHWLFLLQKLDSLSSSPVSITSNNKLKRPISSNPLNGASEPKKTRPQSTPIDRQSLLSTCNLYPPLNFYSTMEISPSTKRVRTRITDDQLRILRAHFNLNNSPSDEQVSLMSQQTQLTAKVIKHWFRNTLFKERQRNKDSPYNFANPPSSSTTIDLDEYHKTGTIIRKIHEQTMSSDEQGDSTSPEDELLSSDDENKRTFQSNNDFNAQKRANRTRFSDLQLRLLQEAFEANPYPKDDDLETLSQRLKLNSRVIVVWFQNARQKARKSYENNQPPNVTDSTPIVIKQERDDGYSCKNCHKAFSRFAELMKHTKQCSTHEKKSSSTSNPTIIKQEITSPSSTTPTTPSTTLDPLASYQMMMAAASMAAAAQQQSNPYLFLPPTISSRSSKDNFCEQCDKNFTSPTEFAEHQALHMQALLNAAAFFPLAAYHPAAAACAAAMAAMTSQLFPTPNPPKSSTPPPPPPPALPPPPIPPAVTKIRALSPASSSGEENEEEDGATSVDSLDKSINGNNTKRNRTTILPEQQDYLMSKYSLESNPSRKMLEEISSQVNLKKRVVQVWFQNTRARERKGNMKIISTSSNSSSTSSTNSLQLQIFHKKCLHCSATFKLKSTLENHLISKHHDLYQHRDQLNQLDFDLFPTISTTQINSTEDLPLDLSKPTTINQQQTRILENNEDEESVVQSNDESEQESDEEIIEENSSRPLVINQPVVPILSNQITTTTTTPTRVPFNGHLSPTGSQQSSSNGQNGQRRFRTQMTPLQIKLMKAIFLEYRTPTMPECELLGRQIQLQKRVVQVWFQNARAKEKKNPNFFKSDFPIECQPSNEECRLCQSKYTLANAQRDHLFTSTHIENIRTYLSRQISSGTSIKEDLLTSSSQSQLAPATTTTTNSNQVVVDSPSTVLESSSDVMSYLNMMHLMPMGMDPYNFSMVDPNIHGTPMFMLQLPGEALNQIVTASKADGHLSRAQYTQDGRSKSELIKMGHNNIDYQTIDVGFACKRCNLVWPLYEPCRCHALLCWQLSPSSLPLSASSKNDLSRLSSYILKIEQLLYRCLPCSVSCSTIVEFQNHLDDERHSSKTLKRAQSIQENDSQSKQRKTSSASCF